MNSLRGLTVLRGRFEVKPQVDPANHKHIVFELNLADCFRKESIACRRNLARLQRASICASQSTGRCSHNVVEGRRVRLRHVGGNSVMLGDRPVNAEDDRLLLGRQVGFSKGTLHTLYPHF
jgi:hypothetical protein